VVGMRNAFEVLAGTPKEITLKIKTDLIKLGG
jgi:hypothetical protein